MRGPTVVVSYEFDPRKWGEQILQEKGDELINRLYSNPNELILRGHWKVFYPANIPQAVKESCCDECGKSLLRYSSPNYFIEKRWLCETCFKALYK